MRHTPEAGKAVRRDQPGSDLGQLASLHAQRQATPRRLPRAPASLGQSAAWAATSGLVSTQAQTCTVPQPTDAALPVNVCERGAEVGVCTRGVLDGHGTPHGARSRDRLVGKLATCTKVEMTIEGSHDATAIEWPLLSRASLPTSQP